MSIRKDVIGRHEVYTIYSSEMKERMKVYFGLTEKYNQCKKTCSSFDEDCEEMCSKIYDSYSDSLLHRYKDDPEKLNEVVRNSPLMTKTKKPECETYWYKTFG